MSFAGRVVVITGGSRGLGLVMARQFAREGAALVLLARDEEELRNAAAEIAGLGAAVITIPCDVRDLSQVRAAMDDAAEFFGQIDVLINNAGVMQVGPLEHMGEEDFRDAWGVHVLGPLHTTLAAVPHMRGGGGGRIVNITSIGGKVAIPHMLPYTLSKFALVGMSDGLRAELRRDGIFVTTVVPGLMRTGSQPNAKFKGDHRAEYAWFEASGSMPGLAVAAERAARQIIDAAREGRPSLVIGAHAKAAIAFNTLAPNLVGWITAAVNRLLLPEPQPHGSKRGYSGWQSRSGSGSPLSRLTDRNAERNNELAARRAAEPDLPGTSPQI